MMSHICLGAIEQSLELQSICVSIGDHVSNLADDRCEYEDADQVTDYRKDVPTDQEARKRADQSKEDVISVLGSWTSGPRRSLSPLSLSLSFFLSIFPPLSPLVRSSLLAPLFLSSLLSFLPFYPSHVQLDPTTVSLSLLVRSHPDSKVHIHATCYFSRSEKCAGFEEVAICSLWFVRSEFFQILFRVVRIWLRVIGANKREQPFEKKTGFEQFVSWDIHEEFLANRKSRFFCLFMIASNASSEKADLSMASVFSLVIRNVIGWNLITGRYLLGLPSWRKRVYGSIYGSALSSVLKEIIWQKFTQECRWYIYLCHYSYWKIIIFDYASIL